MELLEDLAPKRLEAGFKIREDRVIEDVGYRIGDPISHAAGEEKHAMGPDEPGLP